jgi:tRNA C32,U32 (ribose-2'-O)-methylase TrmJ
VSENLENLCVVLVKTRNPLNLGAVARAMSNFGAAELRAVRPYGKAWREARSAVGAGEVMAQAREFATIAEAVADCSLVVGTTSVGNRELKHPLRDLVEAAPLLRERMETGRVAVLFGSEKWGLSNEDLSYCHWLVRIPTLEEHRSMNLGQAAAVVLYEMGGRGGKGNQGGKGGIGSKGGKGSEFNQSLGEFASERRELNAETLRTKRRAQNKAKRADLKASATGKQEEKREFAEMETVERIGEVLLEALVKSGYVGPRKGELAEEKLRRMLRRFSMEAADAEVFLGMMRKIVAKM